MTEHTKTAVDAMTEKYTIHKIVFMKDETTVL